MLAEKMTNRSALIDAFLLEAGWSAASRHPLAGDASFRRYERVIQADKPAMLMDAPPPQEDVTPFIRVTQLLRSYGHSAPEIYAQDTASGFLLLEDLGEDLYSAVLRADGEQEEALYLAAAELLVDLYHRYETVGKAHGAGAL